MADLTLIVMSAIHFVGRRLQKKDLGHKDMEKSFRIIFKRNVFPDFDALFHAFMSKTFLPIANCVKCKNFIYKSSFYLDTSIDCIGYLIGGRKLRAIHQNLIIYY